MASEFAQVFSYNINWRSKSFHTGGHRGTQSGLGSEFRGNVPLVDHPDARRIDVSQTIRDLSEQVHVRTFSQKNPTPVYAVCDLSASMQFTGHSHKLSLAADVVASIAYSAHQEGDAFSFVGFDNDVDRNWLSTPSKRIHEAMTIVKRLRNFHPNRRGSNGLLEVAPYLTQARSLVFLVSDFHMPLKLIEQSLNRLSRHHVVPIVLWDKQEYKSLPSFGFGTILDPESGQQRTLFFRKSLHEKFQHIFSKRKAKLESLFTRYEAPPCFIEDTYKAEAVSEYFQQFSAL